MTVLGNRDIVELTAWRRELHRFPELSGEEAETAARVATGLSATAPDEIVSGLGGHGVAADPAKAAALYAQGAVQGDVGCMAELGECYEHGRGVTRDPEQALALYQAAYDAGFDAVSEAIERVKAA